MHPVRQTFTFLCILSTACHGAPTARYTCPGMPVVIKPENAVDYILEALDPWWLSLWDYVLSKQSQSEGDNTTAVLSSSGPDLYFDSNAGTIFHASQGCDSKLEVYYLTVESSEGNVNAAYPALTWSSEAPPFALWTTNFGHSLQSTMYSETQYFLVCQTDTEDLYDIYVRSGNPGWDFERTCVSMVMSVNHA